MEFDATEEAAVFYDLLSGDEVMRYSGLVAFDADGRELPAQMRATGQNDISLDIDDSFARYPILVDPWLRAHNYDGSQSGAHFGYSIAYFEKFFNEDPENPLTGKYRGSMAIGAPWFDDGNKTDNGKVFLYETVDDNGLPSSPTWTASGDASFANFGYAIAFTDPFEESSAQAGTFKNDVMADLIVGEPLYNGGMGRIFVWFADSSGSFGTANRAADWVQTGTATSQKLGSSLAVMDLDRDEVPDLLAGSPGNAKVYFYKGLATSAGLSSTATIVSGPIGSHFGLSLTGSKAGKLFSGTPVFIVGAPYFNDEQGAIYAYKGLDTGGIDTSHIWTITGPSSTAFQFGWSLFGGTSFDYIDDLLVGVPQYTGSAAGEGAVYIYQRGLTTPSLLRTLTTSTHQAAAKLGWSVAGGNLGDGNSQYEVIVGAPFYDGNPNDDRGEVWIWYNRNDNSSVSPDQLTDLYSGMTGQHFGKSVCYIRKIIFGDPCFAAGAPEGSPNSSSNAGLAVVYQFQP